MNDENFSPAESLQLIQSMISKTKQDLSDNAVYFLLWGWISFIACTGQFILKHIYNYPKHYYVWLLVIPGIIGSVYYSVKENKRDNVKTYISESIKYLWIGMGIAYFVLSMILSKVGWETSVFPFYIMLYGLGTFVSGSIIQFRPLVIGGILASVLAVVATYASYDYQMLFGSAALMVSYIIPAYLLRKTKRVI